MEACRPDQMRTNRAKRGFAHISEVASKPDALTPSGRLGFSRNSDLAPHPPPSFGPRGCSGSDIAPLHFADYPMEQAGSHHFVLAKVCRDVIKEGVAVRYRQGFGGFHQPGEIVVRQSQAQLVEWGHSKLPGKTENAAIPTWFRLPGLGNSLNGVSARAGSLSAPLLRPRSRGRAERHRFTRPCLESCIRNRRPVMAVKRQPVMAVTAGKTPGR